MDSLAVCRVSCKRSFRIIRILVVGGEVHEITTHLVDWVPQRFSQPISSFRRTVRQDVESQIPNLSNLQVQAESTQSVTYIRELVPRWMCVAWCTQAGRVIPSVNGSGMGVIPRNSKRYSTTIFGPRDHNNVQHRRQIYHLVLRPRLSLSLSRTACSVHFLPGEQRGSFPHPGLRTPRLGHTDLL